MLLTTQPAPTLHCAALLRLPQAYDVVGDEAIRRLAHVAGRMLAATPLHMLARMRAADASFAVIGRDQGVTGQ